MRGMGFSMMGGRESVWGICCLRGDVWCSKRDLLTTHEQRDTQQTLKET